VIAICANVCRDFAANDVRVLRYLLLTVTVACSAFGQTYTINTIAGGALPVNVPGTLASLGLLGGIATDSSGNVFFETPFSNVVLRWDASSGALTLAAGSGTEGFSGDGGPATSAQLNWPTGVAVDSVGNLYIADTRNCRVREVSNGVITTVAGNGDCDFSGDNGPATNAHLNGAYGIAVDSAGNLYIADIGNNRIRKVSNGVITTVAGNGTAGFSGDNGPATSAQLNGPFGVTVDSAGNLYITDYYNYRIRKISNGVITTVAGNGTYGFSGDNGPATAAELSAPTGLAVDSAGNLYIADNYNNCVRMVSNGVITTVAGSGTTRGFGGDNGPASSAWLDGPWGVAVDSAGNLYISDTENQRVRKVSKGVIATIAGNGTSFSGDNGPPTSAQLNQPAGVAVDSAGNLYIADSYNNRIRKVSNGVITTVAGNGTCCFSGDNGPATSAQLNLPWGLAMDSAGSLYIADEFNNRVRKISNGVITTVAGNGTAGFSGDNGPATSAQLNIPTSVAVDTAGDLYIADSFNCRIRKVTNGVITTVAGNGICNSSGDNGPATSAELPAPTGVAVDTAGALYIADDQSRVRKVSAGVITTVAGTGTPGFSGDGGPATAAQLWSPETVTLDPSDNLYISGGGLIRRVSGGVITTIAGGGTTLGDNGPATSAELYPKGVAIDARGSIYVADYDNNRVRVLIPAGAPCAYTANPLSFANVNPYGGSLVVNIQTAPGCAWTVQSLPDWIGLSGNGVNSGPGSVTLIAAPNTGAARSATVSLAGLSVSVTQAQGALSIAPGGVVNDASYTAPVAPGSIAAAFGDFMLSSPATLPLWQLPTSISGLSLQFGDGTLAPLFFVSAGQVNFQVPWELAGQAQTTLAAILDGQTSGTQTVGLTPFAPAIFATNSQGVGQGAILDASYSLVDSTNPATAGSTFVLIFCTGLGAVTNQPASGSPAPSSPLSWTATIPTVTIGGALANVSFYGLAPGYVGLYQVNAQVPAGSATGNAVPVTISIGGATSNTVTIGVQGPAGTGTLDIQVTGLPSGTPAGVSVTSPGGYSAAVTANENLQVVPGTYTVVANPVALGNVTYNAIAQQSVNVVAGSSVTVQVPYTTVIPNTTKVLDQTGTSTLTIAPDGSTLTVSAQSAVAQSLAPGDVLAAAPTPAAPHGLLRKVVSVSQAAGQVTATTTPAALTDAIQQADVQFNANLVPQNIKSATALRPGVEVHVGRRSARTRTSSDGALSAVSPMDAGDICANGQIVLTEMQDVEITPGLTVSGDIELCGNFTIQTSLNWLGVQLNSLTATATIGEHTELSIAGQAAVGFSASQPIATIEFGDIVVPVGPIPVDLVPQITILIGASGTVGAGLSVGVSQDASVTGGFSYANGQVSPVLQSTPLAFQLEPLTVTEGITATAFVEADIDLLLYDVAGPYFDPQAYLEFDANVLQNPWWTLSGGLKGPVGFQLNPDLDVLGFDNLPTVSFANLFDLSQTFLQASTGFPSLQALTPNTATAGGQGATLTVTGSNFVRGSTVDFSAAPLATTFVSSSKLTATVPASYLASTGTYPVTVSNPAPGGGTSASVNFTVQAANNPVPTVTSLSSISASAGSGPLTLTITGSGFIASSTVNFNGAPVTTTFVSSSQLTATVPASDLVSAGSFPVTVSNPAPGGGTSASVNFTVGAASNPAPTVTSLLPSSASAGGGPLTLTINGNGFIASSTVTFNGLLHGATFVSASQLSITLSTSDLANAGTFAVVVTNPPPGGGSSQQFGFTVTLNVAQTSVTGRVVWNGTPVPNSVVELKQGYPGDSNPVLASTVSAADGTFTILNPPTGSLSICALAPSTDYWPWECYSVTLVSGQQTNVGDLSISKILQLISPANDGTIATTTPTLEWAAFPGANCYQVEVYNNTTSQLVFYQQCTQNTQITVSPALQTGQQFQWSVYAYNASGQEIACYSVWIFTVSTP
jgi:uncharacterized protein (TIGR03437 family)